MENKERNIKENDMDEIREEKLDQVSGGYGNESDGIPERILNRMSSYERFKYKDLCERADNLKGVDYKEYVRYAREALYFEQEMKRKYENM